VSALRQSATGEYFLRLAGDLLDAGEGGTGWTPLILEVFR